MNCGLRIEEGVAAGPPSLRLPSRAGADRLYKQTQFAPAGTRGLSCDIASMPRFGQQSQTWASWGIGATGRGTSAGQMRQTNPIWPGAQEGAKVGGRPRRGTMAPNKANFRRSNGRGKWLAAKELW